MGHPSLSSLPHGIDFLLDAFLAQWFPGNPFLIGLFTFDPERSPAYLKIQLSGSLLDALLSKKFPRSRVFPSGPSSPRPFRTITDCLV